jgi:hypothetical protein
MESESDDDAEDAAMDGGAFQARGGHPDRTAGRADTVGGRRGVQGRADAGAPDTTKGIAYCRKAKA